MCWFSYRSLKNLFPQKFPCPDFYRKANLCPNIILLCKSFLIICKIQFCKNYFFNKITKFYYLALLLLFSKALPQWIVPQMLCIELLIDSLHYSIWSVSTRKSVPFIYFYTGLEQLSWHICHSTFQRKNVVNYNLISSLNNWDNFVISPCHSHSPI